jgi:sporulation protein YlmC with PRC-barrel domain
MKFSELKGRAVVNLEDARKIGTVEDLMVEPESHHIASVKVRTGMFHAAQVIPVADVKNVGGDAVTISTGAGTANITSMAETTAGQHMGASQGGISSVSGTTTTHSSAASVGSQPLIEITSLLGNKVVTDAGTMVGELSDVMIDWVDLTITGYEVHLGGMFTKAQEFVDTPGVRYGNKLITMPAELLTHPN